MATMVRPMSVSPGRTYAQCRSRRLRPADRRSRCTPDRAGIFTQIIAADMGASASSAFGSAAAAASCSRFCSAVRIWYVRMNANIISSTTPSQRAMVRSGAMAPSSSTASRENGQRPVTAEQRFIHHKRADSGGQTSHHQQIKNVRADNIADRNSFAPRRAAVTLTASSGMDVPNATMVRPISSGDTPSLRAQCGCTRNKLIRTPDHKCKADHQKYK